MALNARSIAPCNLASLSPRAVISTNVPRAGRARRTLFEAGFISRQDTAHALGHMAAGKRCATDIVDAAVESEPRARSFADELFSPIRIANFTAVTFPVIQNLDLLNCSLWRKRHCIIDHEMFADDVVDNKKSAKFSILHGTPDFLAAQKLFLSTIRLDRFDLRRCKPNMRGDKLIGLRKAQFLGCRDSQVLLCIGRQRNGDAERGRQDPTWNVSHAEVPDALLEKETDCPEQMICAWRVRRVIERELVVHF